jgi:hypothetical protein
MVGRMETPPLRSVPRRSLPDRLAVDLRSSIVAFFGPPVASKVALRIKATNSAKVVLSWRLEERGLRAGQSPLLLCKRVNKGLLPVGSRMIGVAGQVTRVADIAFNI